MRDDRHEREDAANAEPERKVEGPAGLGLVGSDSAIERRFWLALASYAGLAGLVWFTMGEGKVLVQGKPVELRYLPLIILGGLALRTFVAYRAEKIRRGA